MEEKKTYPLQFTVDEIKKTTPKTTKNGKSYNMVAMSTLIGGAPGPYVFINDFSNKNLKAGDVVSAKMTDSQYEGKDGQMRTAVWVDELTTINGVAVEHRSFGGGIDPESKLRIKETNVAVKQILALVIDINKNINGTGLPTTEELEEFPDSINETKVPNPLIDCDDEESFPHD